MTTQRARERRRFLWIIEHYAALPLKDGRAGRHVGLARELARHGWTTSLLVASTSHPDGKQRMVGRALRSRIDEPSVRAVILRTNSYGSSMGRRFIGMIGFTGQVLLPVATKGLDKPDVIIGSTVHPFAAWAGARLARRHGVPFVFEVRDVWPDYLVELGKVDASSALARLLSYVMRKNARDASLIISPLRGLRSWLDEIGEGHKAFVWISNGVDASDIESLQAPEAVESPTGDESPAFTLMYLGSQGPANTVDHLLRSFDLATRLRPNVDLRLRVIGEGRLNAALKRLASELPSSDRITFEPAIPRSDVVATARQAQALVLAMPDKRVYRFGVSPNKVFDYLLAARPIIMSVNHPNPVEDASAGIVVQAEDVPAFAEAIASLTDMTPTERREMGERGRRHVLDRYTYARLADDLAQALSALADSRTPPSGPEETT